jgi:hypothetical protein
MVAMVQPYQQLKRGQGSQKLNVGCDGMTTEQL